MITRDEWLQALGDAVQPVDPEALTIKDIEREFGLNRHQALAKVTGLIAEGTAKRVLKVVHRANGAPYRSPAYKLVTPKPSKRK